MLPLRTVITPIHDEKPTETGSFVTVKQTESRPFAALTGTIKRSIAQLYRGESGF
jgi:hypothetical protein